MRDTCYLVIDKDGVRKMLKSKPSLKSGQYAVRLTVSVADRFFDVAIPTAQLTIGEEHLIEPEIDVGLDPEAQRMLTMPDPYKIAVRVQCPLTGDIYEFDRRDHDPHRLGLRFRVWALEVGASAPTSDVADALVGMSHYVRVLFDLQPFTPDERDPETQ